MVLVLIGWLTGCMIRLMLSSAFHHQSFSYTALVDMLSFAVSRWLRGVSVSCGVRASVNDHTHIQRNVGFMSLNSFIDS